MPSDLDPPHVQTLAAAWRAQFEEHPFLLRSAQRRKVSNPLLRFTSVMFRDFVASERLLGSGDTLAAEVSGNLLDPDFVASPVLARFMAAGLRGADEPLSVRALPALLESVASDLTEDALQIQVDEDATDVGSEEDAPSHISVTISARGRSLAVSSVSVPLTAGLELGRAVGRLVMDVPSFEVSAPASRRDLRFGDSVDIVCRALLVDVEDVRVQSKAMHPTRIKTGSFETRTLRVFASDPAGLRLVADVAKHPWHNFLWQENASSHDADYETYDAALKFRQLLKWFLRPSMAGRLTYPSQPMDTIVAKGRINWDLFYFLQSQDYLENVGSMYRLSEPVPARDIMQLNMTNPEYLKFLGRFISWRDAR